MKVGDLVIRKVTYDVLGLIINAKKCDYSHKDYFAVQWPREDELFYYETKELVVINESR